MLPARIILFLLLAHLLGGGAISYPYTGHESLHTHLSPCQLSQQSIARRTIMDDEKWTLMTFLSPRQKSPQKGINPSLAPSPVPSQSPQASTAGPSSSPLPHRSGGHHRHLPKRPRGIALSPSEQGCDQICTEPLTMTSFGGSSCGCVFPMNVKLLLAIAPYVVFPLMRELEIEIATGTYLQQSQVVIMGASADAQNQGTTVVDINLVPLGEKFDNTTTMLMYNRFMHKKFHLNTTLFGHYEVISISYPGMTSSQPGGSHPAKGPSQSTGDIPETANPDNRSQEMNLRVIAIIALSVLVLLLVIIGAISVFIKWRKDGKPSSAINHVVTSSLNKLSGIGSILSSSKESSTSASLMSTMPTSVLSVKTFPLAELQKATGGFTSKKVLGEGGFGRVYHGLLDGIEVAVKVLTKDNQNGGREFIAEVEMLSRLHHRNLVKLHGICIEGRKRCLVYELVPNGSVESHLHGVDKDKEPLDWDSRLKIALGAARALAYLHEDSNPRVIHRDFKASNVLLEDDFTPKVSDFGLAREATEGSQHISTRVMGTFGYVAPEYAMTGHLLVKSDVYSYGVVLLELLTGRKPVDMSQPSGQENLVTWARPLLTSREGVQQLVDPFLAGTYDFNDLAKVAAIASMCVHPEVTHRPFMGEVVQALKLIYNDTDETGGDCCSHQESSVPESDFKCDLAFSESGWWNAGGVTMDYSSGRLEETENRFFSSSSFVGDGISLPIKHGNRSGPLRMIRSKPNIHTSRGGSMSEHGGLLPRQFWSGSHWV